MSFDCLQIKDEKRRNLLQKLQLVLESIEPERKCGWENGPKKVVETQVVCTPLRVEASPLSGQYSPFPTDSEQRLKFEAIRHKTLPQIYHDGTNEIRYTTSEKILQESSDSRNYEYLPEFEREHKIPCDMKNYKDIELRGGVIYRGCNCVKRNGLQHDCLRSGCREQTCLNKPEPDCIPSGGCGFQGPPPRTRKHPATYPVRRLDSPISQKQPICRAEVPCIICNPQIKNQRRKHEVNQTFCRSTSYLNQLRSLYDKCRECCCSYISWSKPKISQCACHEFHEPQKPQYAPRIDWAKVDRSVPPECQIPRQPPCFKTYGELCTTHDRKPCFEVYCRYCKIHEPKIAKPVRRYTNLDYFQQW